MRLKANRFWPVRTCRTAASLCLGGFPGSWLRAPPQQTLSQKHCLSSQLKRGRTVAPGVSRSLVPGSWFLTKGEVWLAPAPFFTFADSHLTTWVLGPKEYGRVRICGAPLAKPRDRARVFQVTRLAPTRPPIWYCGLWEWNWSISRQYCPYPCFFVRSFENMQLAYG